MNIEFTDGYAFILEGDTEKEFYLAFLEYLCNKHSAKMERIIDEDSPDIIYLLRVGDTARLIKFHVANAITQIPNAGRWFNTQCVNKYRPNHNWYVFLCYDMDCYKYEISKYFEGDWEYLRKALTKAKQVVDMCAAADIEDVMLCDIKGICNFIGCAVPEYSLKGSKGKVKLKNLFRQNGITYHEGKRSRPLIDALDMEVIISANLVPLQEIERIVFGTS